MRGLLVEEELCRGRGRRLLGIGTINVVNLNLNSQNNTTVISVN